MDTTRTAPPDSGRDSLDSRQGLLLGERSRLINLAYRLLGTLADAEDAVQEAYARWYALSPDQQREINSPGAWLNTVTSRICLDLLGSARTRRERYVGEWLPEPVPDPAEAPGQAASDDPADRITLDESVDMAFMVVLDAMTPAERVAFLLHDVFGYRFAEVAEIVGRTPAACRQLASSARRRTRSTRPVDTSAAQRARTVSEFKRAWEAKDIDGLVGLLDPSVVVIADGGGRASALLHPIEGGELVARYLVDLAARAGAAQLVERTVNGQAGIVATVDGVIISVLAFEIVDDRIRQIWAVRNPEKLRSWATL